MLLLHTWRRIVLHDPQLPMPMLPERWPGHAARALCGQIYWKLFDASEQHLDAVDGRDNERYTPLAPAVSARFGGRPAASPVLVAPGVLGVWPRRCQVWKRVSLGKGVL